MAIANLIFKLQFGTPVFKTGWYIFNSKFAFKVAIDIQKCTLKGLSCKGTPFITQIELTYDVLHICKRWYTFKITKNCPLKIFEKLLQYC